MEKTPISVTQLNNYVKTLIGSNPALSDVLVSGELSSFKRHAATGHLYFDLKDQNASVRAVMFSSDASRLAFNAEDGMKVIIRGRVGVFEKTGVYQIYVKTMEPDGLGSLYLEYLKLKNKLEAEGLFREDRKRPFKRLPKTVAVITSKSGAVIRDIENVLSRRYPLCKVLLFPAVVQGDEAPQSIVSAFSEVSAVKNIDAVILARGGGSQLDLWCFNDERVAYAISRCPYPVISAVGHETDFTIADFVADKRAPTPSAAAELVAADVKDILKYIDNEKFRMASALSEKLIRDETRINTVLSHQFFRKPLEYLEDKQTGIVYLTERILRSVNFSEKYNGVVEASVLRMKRGLDSITGSRKEAYLSVLPRLQNSINSLVTNRQNELVKNVSKLKAMDPMNVLTRGYAAVQKNGKIISGISEIENGDEIAVRFNDGTAYAKVTERMEQNGK